MSHNHNTSMYSGKYLCTFLTSNQSNKNIRDYNHGISHLFRERNFLNMNYVELHKYVEEHLELLN